MISIEDIYNQDINFLFGSGASFGLLPTLQLQVQTGVNDRRYTLEELATKFEREKDRRLIPLFMHYYANCIRPAENLRLEAVTTELGTTVIKNYRTFLLTALEMVKRRTALDRRCNVFTTNYDGCFPLVADALIEEGHVDFVLNDGARGFTRRIVQARNFGAYLCHAGVFGRYQSSIPQINLIHLHGSVYWSKQDAAIRVDYDLRERQGLLDANALALLQPFSIALNNPVATINDVPDTGFTDDALDAFWAKYELMPIVNPTKWKFHETVYEEHYYQMLRLLSYELEKPNAVLITFGFSFADEHILNLVMRSLSNPRLQVFVCCFNRVEHTSMEQKFKGHRNVKCLVLKDGVMNFTAFNEKVLAHPNVANAQDTEHPMPVATAATDDDEVFGMSIRVGEVIAVHGTKVVLKIDEQSSKEMLFFDGDKYKGVSIREYLSIQRGFRDIICTVEGEYLDESRTELQDGKQNFVRKVEARPIGYFDNAGFTQGIKYLPMIQDSAYLMPEEKIRSIFDRKADDDFRIGQMLKEEIAVGLPWRRLFNSHIGIFGNTGSGKSNTLAKLYTVLFDKKLPLIAGKSRFVVLDFNGEYGGEQLAPAASKKVYQLSTLTIPDPNEPTARFPLAPQEFWELETMALLFQATANTQRPFLNRVIWGKQRFGANPESLAAYAKAKFKQSFCAGEAKPATLDLMRTVAKRMGNQNVLNLLGDVTWYRNGRFNYDGVFIDPDGVRYDARIAPIVDSLAVGGLDDFDQLVLRVNLQLLSDLNAGYVQFEHIQPLLKRIESSLASLRKVLTISEEAPAEHLLTVISMRRCNNEIKKVLPLLFAKHYYNSHKTTVANPPDRTIHVIVDEAHNILSEQSVREAETWKDYRLEQFEEIIKEGRKFGMFITIASQRPADISPTIVSQLHNFFIHRLVNDRDLYLVDNTISTLDALSRSLIPGLSQGCCVVTGTAFELPMVIQVDRLPSDKQPASEDVDLEKLWSMPPITL